MLRICQQYLRMQHSEPVVGQSTHSDVHVDHRPADTHCNVHARGGAIFQNTYCDVHAAWESGMGPEYRIAMSTQLVDHTELCMTFCNVHAAHEISLTGEK